MAASGCMDKERGDDLELPVKNGFTLLDMIRPERLFKRSEYDFTTVRSGNTNGAGIAKCFERLNGMNKVVSPALDILKNAGRRGELAKDSGEFQHERRNHRYDRAASTDSVATSSGGSDSCQSSSDSGGVSAPSSPAESELSEPPGTPQPMPPLPQSLLLLDDASLPATPPSCRTRDKVDGCCHDAVPSDVSRVDRREDVEDVEAVVAQVLRHCLDSVVAQSSAPSQTTVVCERSDVPPSSPKIDTTASPSTSSSSKAGGSSPRGVFCRWTDCGVPLACVEVLADHVRTAHVEPQLECAEKRSFFCRWEGCKVYDRRSSSRQWLERHVLLCHGGPRPFACIVDGCGQRFPSQSALERHVNAHFDPKNPSRVARGPGVTGGGTGGPGCGTVGSVNGVASAESPLKLLRLRRRLRCRRRGWATAKHDDFFDACVLEQLRYQLVEMTSRQSPLDMHSHPGGSVTFHGTVIARRREEGDQVKLLMHWVPEHVLPDTWVPENHSAEKVVPISSLSDEALRILDLWPFASSSSGDRGATRPCRRKRK